MSRRDTLVRHEQCSEDCALEGWQPATIKRPWWVWRVVKYAALFVLSSLVMGTGYSALFVEPCEAQVIVVDTTTPQYQKDSGAVMNLARSYVAPYAQRLHLAGWMIVLRADTLSEGISAQTWVYTEYRNAQIIVDLTKSDPDGIAQVVLHEVLHIKVAPLGNLGLWSSNGIVHMLVQQEIEALVTDLTRSILWAQNQPTSRRE